MIVVFVGKRVHQDECRNSGDHSDLNCSAMNRFAEQKSPSNSVQLLQVQVIA